MVLEAEAAAPEDPEGAEAEAGGLPDAAPVDEGATGWGSLVVLGLLF